MILKFVVCVSEPQACVLQSYISRERDRISLAPSRPASVVAYSAPGTIRSVKSEVMTRPPIQINGQTSVSPVISREGADGITTVSRTSPLNGVIRGEVHVERPPSLYDERPVDANDLEVSSIGRRGYRANSYHLSPVHNMGTSQQDVKRSVSSASRQSWKDQMRRKHLPPIFVNEGYEPSDKSPSTEEETKVKKIYKEGLVSQYDRSALNYYMSSDYHPDCLTDSLPRNKVKHAPSTESEGGEMYRNEDIEEVLNTSSQARRTPSISCASDRTNSFRSFKSSPDMSRHKRNTLQKGVYSTFEDLSKMDMRHEDEIEFDNEAIPLEEIHDGYNNAIAIQANPQGVNTINYNSQQRYVSSFKPESSHSHTFPIHTRRDGSHSQIATTKFGSRSIEENKTPDLPQTTCVPKEIQALAQMRNEKTSFQRPVDVVVNTHKFKHGDTQNLSRERSETVMFQTTFDKRDNSIDDENASSGSNSSGSVTIRPYKEDMRRKPWMDDIDEHSQIGEPLVGDSDTETLRDSHESNDFRLGLNYEYRYPGSSRSELSTPVSSIFDEETDRGFEDALDMHINSGVPVYGGVGLCFESIKEEPEDLASSGSNPFLNNGNGDDEFRTRAVISRSSKSNSRTSSCTSVGENPFSPSPRSSIYFSEQPTAPAIVTTDVDLDFADSGFTSGLDRGNASDSSGQHENSYKDRVSPWGDDTQRITNTDMSFESNFCSKNDVFKTITPALKSNCTEKDAGAEFCKEEKNISDINSIKKSPIFEGRKPFHKAVEAIKVNNRPTPLRVRSFERYNSPVPERRLPKRGHSFETDRSDVKPAYF